MKAFLAIIRRDITLAARAGGDVLTLILFFTMIGVIVPFAIGPDSALLEKLSPGIVWIAAFLSTLLGLDRLFKTDHEDGTLMAWRHASISLSTIAFAKLIAHWLTAILPLIAATPILALLLSMDGSTLVRTIVSLLVGSPALVALGAIGAAVTVALKRGGLIAPVLIVPLAIPVLIFGTAAISANAGPDAERVALMFLSGLSLAFMVLTPFAAALALRLASE